MSASDTLVRNNTPRDQYTANANQTTFDFNFLIFDSSDLVVLETKNPGTNNESTSTLSAGADYTVSGVGDEDGGSITLNTGADSGDLYTIFRDTVIDRLTDFLQSGEFDSETVNLEYDTIITILQELHLELKRAATLQREDEVSSLNLPLSEAGKYLAWNQSGDALENISGSTGNPLPMPAMFGDSNLLSLYSSEVAGAGSAAIAYNAEYDSDNDRWDRIDSSANNPFLIVINGNLSGLTGISASDLSDQNVIAFLTASSVNNSTDEITWEKSKINSENRYSKSGVDLSGNGSDITHGLNTDNINVSLWDETVSPPEEFLPSTLQRKDVNTIHVEGGPSNARVVVTS